MDDLVAAKNCILADSGVLDAFGHVSVRHDRNPERFMISRSLAAASRTLSNTISTGGASTSGDEASIPKDSSMRRFIHAHAPSLIPFGVSSTPLRPMYHMAGFIGDGIPIFDIRASAGITDMLVKDAAKGRALAQALGNKAAVLMRGHGVAVVGAMLPIAVGRSIYLDLNARTHVMKIEVASGREVQQAVDAFYSSNGSDAKARPDDLFFLAMEEESMIGCVRYCVENEVPMLRTMRVARAYQRQGVGLAMLTRFVHYLDEHQIRNVFCLPYAHLDRFYGLRGFVSLPANEAPARLRSIRYFNVFICVYFWLVFLAFGFT